MNCPEGLIRPAHIDRIVNEREIGHVFLAKFKCLGMKSARQMKMRANNLQIG
jgi:hypothetical protein